MSLRYFHLLAGIRLSQSKTTDIGTELWSKNYFGTVTEARFINKPLLGIGHGII
jgi:hypothetical protein